MHFLVFYHHTTTCRNRVLKLANCVEVSLRAVTLGYRSDNEIELELHRDTPTQDP